MRRLPNLGAVSTQRSKSFHSVVKSRLNPLIAVEEAVDRIVRNIGEKIKAIRLQEDKSYHRRDRTLNWDTFKLLFSNITSQAIRHIRIVWE